MEELNIPPSPQQYLQAPPNYTFMECEPVITYLSPPPITTPELDYNTTCFFYFDDVEGLSFCSRKALREAIKHPEMNTVFAGQNKREGIYMMKDGSAKVAHVPNRLDVVHLPDGFQPYLQWALDEIDDESDDIVPQYLLHLLDSRPIIRASGPIYLLRHEPVDVLMGTYTNAFHVFHVMAPTTDLRMEIYTLKYVDNPIRTYRATAAFFHGRNCVDGFPLPCHTSLIVWNVRGLGRPSFITNFQKMVGLHEPKVVVLLEARVCFDEFDLIIQDLESEMRWGCIEGCGISGGLVILWDSMNVDFKVHSCNRGLDLRLSGTIKVKSPPFNRRRVLGA